jgi:sec-independent protein translocase protein TatA
MTLLLLGILGGLGGGEIMLIIFALLLLFGGKKIPELARGLGKGIREFNNARANIETEIKDGIRDAERTDKKVD